ncbi:MAG: LamG domain-containing protein [Planctomycetota bacterium]
MTSRIVLSVLALFFVRLCAAGEEGLVLHYTFEEGPGEVVKDTSGAGNHGKNLGAGYVKLGEGKGYCLAFDTADATVDCGNDASLDLTTALTIELWFLPQTEFKQGEAGVVGKNIDSYTLAFTPHKVCYAYLASEGGAPRTDARARLGLGSWLHIAATFDGEGAKLYVDGKLEDSVSAVAPRIRSAKDKFYLRYPVVWGSAVEPTFKCMMDDVRVYNRALSDDEILAHYKEGAAKMGKDTSWFGRIKLTPHLYPLSSVLLVEVDYAFLKPVPAGSSVSLELRKKGGESALRSATLSLASRTFTYYISPRTRLAQADKVEWSLSTADLPGGEYEVQAIARDASGAALGELAVSSVVLPAEKPSWLAANHGARALNNLVVELVDLRPSPGEALTQCSFFLPYDRWVFVSSEADPGVRLTFDDDLPEQAFLVHEGGAPASQEAMRYLSAGEHAIKVRREGDALLKRLIVRSVPTLLFSEIGHEPCPWVKCYGPYDWGFLARAGVFDSVNVILERTPLPENAEHVRSWKAQGKKILTYLNVVNLLKRANPFTADNAWKVLSEAPGFADSDRDGLMIDEFDSDNYPPNQEDYIPLAEAVEKLSKTDAFRGKMFYPYGKSMGGDYARIFLRTLLDSGYAFAEEIYLQEQPTLAAAREYLDAALRQRVLRYQADYPDFQKSMVAVLAYFSIPKETVNVNPGASYKVFMDMQMNMLANDPVFSELRGVMWYHVSYADEESVRWSAKLFRHYCIEGRREMLSSDPYELRHIENPDFEEGAKGWSLDPAEKDGISFGHMRSYSWLQGRYPRTPQGERFLVTVRSAAKPNRFSQPIRNLEPGRLYSVKMFTADHKDLSQGVWEKKTHDVQIRIDGAQALPERSICELFSTIHGYPPFTQEKPAWITYRVVFFRARDAEALLTVSDWASDEAPIGPIGQELMHNFIEVEPYLED